MGDISIDKLTDIERTALIILFSRALQSKNVKSFINDSKAEEIFDRLDFSDHDVKRILSNSDTRKLSNRYIYYDIPVIKLIEENPELTVIEAGCGLSTRFSRLDNSRLKWFDFDLPEIMKLRKKFIIDIDRHLNSADSILEDNWLKTIKKETKPPYVFISEGVLGYFKEEQVKDLFNKISANFDEAYYVFESLSDYGLKLFNKSNIKKNIDTSINWAINNVYDIEKWNSNFKLIESRSSLDLPDVIKMNIPGFALFLAKQFQKSKKFSNMLRINTVKLS